jgi:hypothetical protein
MSDPCTYSREWDVNTDAGPTDSDGRFNAAAKIFVTQIECNPPSLLVTFKAREISILKEFVWLLPDDARHKSSNDSSHA